MRLATSTNIVCERPGGMMMPLEQTLRLAHAAGFERFDINFYDWSLPGSPFLTDRWQAWIDGVVIEARRLGLVFYQSHLYTFDFLDPSLSQTDVEHHKALLERSMICCHKLGAKVVVSHVQTDFQAKDLLNASIDQNVAFFKPWVAKAKALGMKMAVENSWYDVNGTIRKFGATAEEMMAFVRAFDDDDMGICWDFEHADIMELDQVAALEVMAPALVATHVSDTHSKTDHDLMHVLPLTGGIRWDVIVPTLRKIVYQGDFCLEAHQFIKPLPDEVLPAALRLAYEVGRYLLSL